MNLSKELENIIRNNVKFDASIPWGYIVYLNKHIPHGTDALNRKIAKIEQYAERNNGYCKVLDDFRFVGDNLTARIEMNCDCVAAKAFDAVVEEKERPFIYLSMNKDAVWSACSAAARADNHAVCFCEEKEYPVELFYERVDINGSGVFEKEVCNNRDELIRSLNWLGECGFTPWQVWDFDIQTSRNEKVLGFFKAASNRRFEEIQAAFDDPTDATLDDQIDAALAQINNKVDMLSKDLGKQDRHDTDIEW